MLKLLLIIILAFPYHSIAKQNCKEYDKNLLILFHQSLELQCEKQPRKYYNPCIRLLKKLAKYNKLKAQDCPE